MGELSPAVDGMKSPLLLPILALVLGLSVATGLAIAYPSPEPWVIELPTWLASQLSPLGDRNCVLERPQTLWLMPIAILAFLLAIGRRSLVDLGPVQIASQLLARLALLFALALALSLPTLQSPTRGKTVVFAVDVSASIDDAQLAAAQGLLRRAIDYRKEEDTRDLDREDRTRIRLVTYGARARAIDLDLDDPDAQPLIPRDPKHALASDHAGGLRLAAALVDPESEGRLLLITDGGGSMAERADLAATLRELGERDLQVHTRSFPARARADLVVRGVHLPEELRVGQTFEVVVDLQAVGVPVEQSQHLQLRLEQNGTPNSLAPFVLVDLPGKSPDGIVQVRLSARVIEPGPVVFTAILDTDRVPTQQNRERANDRASVVSEVRGRPRVLLASVDDKTQALARALRADHLHVELRPPKELPQTVNEFRPFDLVIFSDLPASRVSKPVRQALVSYVENYGGGFIMIGGEGSFGVGGWGNTSIEELLPVRFEGERQRDQPTLALVLVIDKSGSMSSEDRLDLVKEAARLTAATLDPSDEIGVIAFDSYPYTLVRLQPAANRLRIAGDIRRLNAGGGTNALPALREAFLQLVGSRALVKHVILLSDGQSPEAGVAALQSDMRDADITVSAVGVGAGAGKDFLARVAERGRGRYYFSQDGTDVPRIFSRETREVTRNAVNERLLYPRIAKQVQALRGIDFGRAPGLRGIIPIKPKALAEVLLKTHDGEPLLVRGRRGLGRTAAFASDAKPRWAAHWLRWGSFAKFWSQIARDTMRQGAGLIGGAEIRAIPAANEGSWNIVVDVDATAGFANLLSGEVEIIDPSADRKGEPERVKLSLTAPGRYEATIAGVDASGGSRLLKARLFDPEILDRPAVEATGQVSIPSPAEIAPDNLVVDSNWLRELPVEAGLKTSHEGPLDELLTTPATGQGRMHTKALWPVVLWALVLPLLFLDLLLRRLSFGRRRLRQA
ncbi:MAG TPA: VWA domain-containing protein [Nannocystis exedens]|nr:VWA domain-containing protein [Nannocystis exedens]